MTDYEIECLSISFIKETVGNRNREGECETICERLKAYLDSLGVKADLTEGEIRIDGNEWHHYWLTLPNGKIIDPTASQFVRSNATKMKNLYVKTAPAYYYKFTAKDYDNSFRKAVLDFEKRVKKA